MEYERYLKEIGVRKIGRPAFMSYLRKFDGYNKTISYLKKPKQTQNHKGGKYKVGNIPEILDYAKMFSIDKAAKEYGISSRSIYRYMEKFNN